MKRADDLVHAVCTEMASAPVGGTEQEKRLHVGEPNRGIGIASFSRGKELQRRRKFLLILITDTPSERREAGSITGDRSVPLNRIPPVLQGVARCMGAH